MAAEEVSIGELVFEQDEDPDHGWEVTVRKVGDLEGWVTFILCPEDELEWTTVRNNCFPLNGRSGPPPLDQWVVHEYVGLESSSLNLEGDRSQVGFTDSEIVSLVAVVNLAFPPSKLARVRREREGVDKPTTH